MKYKVGDLIVDNIVRGLGVKWEDHGRLILPKKTPAGDLAGKMIKTYMIFEDIFGNQDNSEKILIKELQRYNTLDLVQTLSKLNYLVAIDYSGSKLTQEQLIKSLVPSSMLRKYLDVYSGGSGERVFIYEHQLLYLMKLAIQNPRIKGILCKDGKDDIHRILMRSTSILSREFPHVKAIEGLDKEVAKDLSLSIVRAIWINSHEQFRYRFPRYCLIYFKYLTQAQQLYPNESIDILDEFQKITGIEPKLFIGFSFGIWALYQLKPHKDLLKDATEFVIGPGRFKELRREARHKVISLFEYFADSLEAHSKSLRSDDTKRPNGTKYGFEGFMRKPLLKISDGNYFPLDMNYVEDKTTTGIFWILHDHLLNAFKQTGDNSFNKSRMKAKAIYGRAVEFYVGDIFKRIDTQLGRKTAYLQSDGFLKRGVDCVIHESGTLFLFEVTTSTLPMKCVISANAKEFQEYLKRLFFGDDDRKAKKIIQLCDTIKSAREGSLDIPDLKGKTFDNIYPVIVFERIPNFPGKTWELCWEVIKEAKPPYLDVLKHLTFIDLEELEMLEAEIISSRSSFSNIWDEMIEKNDLRYPVKNYLLFSRPSEAKNNYLRSVHYKISAELRNIMFDTGKKAAHGETIIR